MEPIGGHGRWRYETACLEHVHVFKFNTVKYFLYKIFLFHWRPLRVMEAVEEVEVVP